MKHLKQIILLAALMSMVGVKTFAYDAEIDGVYYNFSGSEAVVTYKIYFHGEPLSYYSGDVVIPETVVYDKHIYNVTRIGDYAFIGCTELTSVTIPNSVTSIGSSAFQDCTSLTSITIPNSVTNIGNDAFSYCGLTSVTIPNSVTSIGNYAFYSCDNLTSIIIPSSVISIGDLVFGECVSLTSIVVESGNPIYDSRDNCNALIETASNTLIRGCMNTVIPNGVTSISDRAFRYCLNLTSIDIPNSVTTIGNEAFKDCFDLTSVSFGNSVTTIGNYAFGVCNNLTSIVIPNSVTSIGFAAFNDCSGLKKIAIGNGITSIGETAFYGCDDLSSIKIDKTEPVSIEENTFNNRGSVLLYVPYGCKPVYEEANYWKDFREIQESIIAKNIDGVTIYYGGISSSEVSVRSGDEEYIGEITIPSSITYSGKNYDVTRIGFRAFCCCKKLMSVTIPSSVTSIYESAFSGCSGLTSVTIPSSVTSLGWGAFADCSNLTTVILRSSNPIYINGETFLNSCANTTLYVPTGSKTAYEEYGSWNEFKEIKEYTMGDVNGDGDVDIADAVCIVNHVVGKNTPVFIVAAADVNHDGDVDIADAVRIVNLVVGKIDAFARETEWNLPEPQ